jgi:hypothetical protein
VAKTCVDGNLNLLVLSALFGFVVSDLQLSEESLEKKLMRNNNTPKKKKRRKKKDNMGISCVEFCFFFELKYSQ